MKIFLKTLICLVFILAIIKTSRSQDSYDNTISAIKKMYELIDNKKIDDAMMLIDANAVDHTPFPGQKQGPEGFREIFNMLTTAFPDFKQNIIDIIINSDGTKACILAKMSGTQKGEFMGIPASGNKMDVLISDIIYLKNGKATDHWGFIDSDTMIKQLGMNK